MKRAKLEEFRQAAYKHLGRAHDATFELTDAILLTRKAYSLADLSLSPVFRRKTLLFFSDRKTFRSTDYW